MAETTRSRTHRWMGEFAVVFLGVALALAADDFRERWSEAREARETLSVIEADLLADSLDFAAVRESMRSHAQAAEWLVERWGAPVEADSVVLAFADFTSRTALQLSSSAFRGLQNTNRIRLLDSDTLRTSLLFYYQTLQPAIQDFNRTETELRERLIFETLPPHVENLPGSGDGLWPPVSPSLALRRPWNAVADDPTLHSEVVWLGRYADYSVELLERGEAAAGSLRALIRGFLR